MPMIPLTALLFFPPVSRVSCYCALPPLPPLQCYLCLFQLSCYIYTMGEDCSCQGRRWVYLSQPGDPLTVSLLGFSIVVACSWALLWEHCSLFISVMSPTTLTGCWPLSFCWPTTVKTVDKSNTPACLTLALLSPLASHPLYPAPNTNAHLKCLFSNLNSNCCSGLNWGVSPQPRHFNTWSPVSSAV